MFAINGGTGFQITFDNGYTVSVQFGAFHYCSNRTHHTEGNTSTSETWRCRNAEVAVMNKDGFVGGWPHAGVDDVQGFMSAEQVADVIAWARSQPGEPVELENMLNKSFRR